MEERQRHRALTGEGYDRKVQRNRESGGRLLTGEKMEFQNIQSEGAEYEEAVWALYEDAFPEEEKKPEEYMRYLASAGKMELLALVEDGVFLGLAMNMIWEHTALLDYLAIAPDKRDGGWGSRAVGMLLERFREKKYILEIEMQDPFAPNARERQRRKAFYLRNGLKETGVFANVYHTDFELLTPDGVLTYEAYEEMLRNILGEEGMRRINPYPVEGPGKQAMGKE